MIQKELTPKLIWKLKLPINSRVHHKVFISVSDKCYDAVYEPVYKNIINCINNDKRSDL